MEGVAVEVLAVLGGPEFVGCSAGFGGALAGVVGELVEELSEFLLVDIEVTLGGFNELLLEFGF